MEQLDWPEMRRYWETHAQQRAPIDDTADPDGLNNVCYTGAPLWLNQYHATLQRAAYLHLLSKVDQPPPGARALDVGCGAGRWCKILAACGYDVVGIDLQPSLIVRDTAQHPGMKFHCTAIQDYNASEPYDLISSVTVIQHNPYEEQRRVLAKLRSLLRVDGWALLLENVHDHAPDVFSRTIEDWTDEFSATGFTTIEMHRYDYSPVLRSLRRAVGGARRAVGRDPYRGSRDLDQFRVAPPRSSGRGRARAANALATSIAVAADRRIEPLLTKQQVRRSSIHCGFLLRAV